MWNTVNRLSIFVFNRLFYFLFETKYAISITILNNNVIHNLNDEGELLANSDNDGFVLLKSGDDFKEASR